MLSLVPDTNILVQGFLSNMNTPRTIINMALAGKIVLYGSSETYAEFRATVSKPKLAAYLSRKRYTVESICLTYKHIVNLVEPQGVYEGLKITADPDDDIFFRIAKFQGVKIIVSDDHHLHDVAPYDSIRVVNPQKFVDSLSAVKASLYS